MAISAQAPYAGSIPRARPAAPAAPEAPRGGAMRGAWRAMAPAAAPPATVQSHKPNNGYEAMGCKIAGVKPRHTCDR